MSTNKKELILNAKHWLDQAKKNGLEKAGINCAFLFWDASGNVESGVCATTSKEQLPDQLKGILKKMGGSSVIVDPYGRN